MTPLHPSDLIGREARPRPQPGQPPEHPLPHETRGTTAPERWRRLPKRWRALYIAAAAGLVLYLASSFVAGIYRPPAGAPTGPSSSLDPSPLGTEAMARLLAARHHPVQSLEVPLTTARLPGRATLLVLDPVDALTPSDGALLRFLRRGGRLVLGGTVSPGTLHALLGGRPVPLWRPEPSGEAHPLARGADDAGVGTVLGGTSGSWRLPPRGTGLSVLLQGSGGPLALQGTVGAGSLVLLASSAPLQNASIAVADDAAFALDLAGPARAPVLFDEYDHGLGPSGTGLAGLPTRWKVALALALLGALVWMWSAARRFGPPQLRERELVPPRVAHVDAMASLLASGGVERLAEGSAPLRAHGLHVLRRLLRADAGASDEQLAELAASGAVPGVTPEVVAALLATPRSPEGVLAGGRAFVALRRRTGPGEAPRA